MVHGFLETLSFSGPVVSFLAGPEAAPGRAVRFASLQCVLTVGMGISSLLRRFWDPVGPVL